MAIETITRCTICKKQDCDGREWKVPYSCSPDKDSKIICTGDTYVRNDKRYHTVVIGHGVIQTFEVEEHEQSDS